MWEYLVVTMIVALALFYVARNLYSKASGQKGCNCGLNVTQCSNKDICSEQERPEKHNTQQPNKPGKDN